MPHGGPDWSTVGPLATVYTLEDMAELAARLGSIDTFDRRGNVIFLDGFEDGIEKWFHDGFGAFHATVWDGSNAKDGGFSIFLTTGNLKDNYEYITRTMFYPVFSRMGLEFSIAPDANVDYVHFRFDLYDGDNIHPCSIKWFPATDLLQYEGIGGAFHDLTPPFKSWPVTNLFTTFKLVVDFITHKYARLIANSYEYDLSAYVYDWDTLVGYAWLNIQILIYTKVDLPAHAYIDNVIITQNEP